MTHNPVKGIKWPSVEGYQGKTRAIGDHQARSLLDFPKNVSLKGKHDRLFWRPCSITPWREELCKLLVKDFKHERRRVAQLKVSRKDGKTPYIPLHPAAGGLILEYLEKLGAWGGCEWDRSFGPSAITAPVHWARPLPQIWLINCANIAWPGFTSTARPCRRIARCLR